MAEASAIKKLSISSICCCKMKVLLQGVPNENFAFQMVVTLKLSISDLTNSSSQNMFVWFTFSTSCIHFDFLPYQFWVSTDLGSQIGNFDFGYSIVCGIFAIFLPIWFYVKSILVDFRRSKTAILTILKVLNFDFWKNFTLEIVKDSQKFKILSYSNSQKWQFLKLQSPKWPKLFSRKNLTWRKILKF